MKHRLTISALMITAISGCSFAGGSAYVGQWKPREHVEFEACLLDPAPPGMRGKEECKDRKKVVTEEPGRRFWGVILAALQFGGSSATFRGETNTQFRFQPSLEVLRGKGRWAYGLRTGFFLESAEDEPGAPPPPPPAPGEEEMAPPGESVTAWDVMAVGHVALFERLSAYAGLGYVPRAGIYDERTSLGARGLLGVQLGLAKTHSANYIVLTLELDRLYLDFGGDQYRSTGLTGHFGIFF